MGNAILGRLKLVKWLLLFLAVAGLIALGVWIGARGCGGNRGAAAPASCSAKVPEGYQPVAEVVTPVVPNPWKPSDAEKKTKGFQAGSKVIEVETNGEPTVKIGILPGGQVVTEKGHAAIVYIKRANVVAFEARPWLAGGATVAAPGPAPAVAVGVDVVKVWRFHGGPAGAVSWRDHKVDVAGGLSGSYNIWRNIDARAAGMYGTAGAAAFAGVDIAIQ